MKNVFERLRSGEAVNMLEEDYGVAIQHMQDTARTSAAINLSYHEFGELGELFSTLFRKPLQEGTFIMPPFYIDFANSINLGKNDFINHNCTCMAAGGITIEDNVQIGPMVTLATTSHDFNDRYVLKCKGIHIKKSVWIGANAVILPGVTVGENAIIAGGSVVTKNVEPNVIVGGNPAKVLKRLDDNLL